MILHAVITHLLNWVEQLSSYEPGILGDLVIR